MSLFALAKNFSASNGSLVFTADFPEQEKRESISKSNDMLLNIFIFLFKRLPRL